MNPIHEYNDCALDFREVIAVQKGPQRSRVDEQNARVQLSSGVNIIVHEPYRVVKREWSRYRSKSAREHETTIGDATSKGCD